MGLYNLCAGTSSQSAYNSTGHSFCLLCLFNFTNYWKALPYIGVQFASLHCSLIGSGPVICPIDRIAECSWWNSHDQEQEITKVLKRACLMEHGQFECQLPLLCIYQRWFLLCLINKIEREHFWKREKNKDWRVRVPGSTVSLGSSLSRSSGPGR